MADVKITGLTAIATPASADLLAIVDVSDTAQSGAGSTRKVTVSNLSAHLGPQVNAKQVAAGNITLTSGTATGYSWRMLGNGTMGWGASESSTVDVTLSRAGAGLLRCDGKLIATGGLGVGNSAAATTPGSVTRKMEVFSNTGVSLGFVAIYGSIS